jgi:hypothetical protein
MGVGAPAPASDALENGGHDEGHAPPYDGRMRRALRYMIHLITALSLTSFVVSVALWARSYRMHESFAWVQLKGSREMLTFRGRLVFSHVEYIGMAENEELGFRHTAEAPAEILRLDESPDEDDLLYRHWSRIGFGTEESLSGPRCWYALWCPTWFIAVLTGSAASSLGMISMRLRRRSARVLAGLCSRCGYDLRATPDRCPECGAIPTSVKA